MQPSMKPKAEQPRWRIGIGAPTPRQQKRSCLDEANFRVGLEDHLSMDPNQYVTNPGLMRAPGRSLRTDAWEQARSRIAQLLPADRFASLAEYYSNVQWFNELLDDHTSPQTRRTFLPDLAHSLAADGSQMREWMREEYIGPMNIGF